MMRAEGGEAAMLLNTYQQAARRDANHRIHQRRRALRTIFEVVGAVALLVGCIAVVDVFALNDNTVESTTLDVRVGDDQPVAMESQFGWSSIGHGWCSLKSSTWCMFSGDKEKCKDNISCYKASHEPEAATGDGSGSGSGSGAMNATVGDEMDVSAGDEDKAPANEKDSHPAGNEVNHPGPNAANFSAGAHSFQGAVEFPVGATEADNDEA